MSTSEQRIPDDRARHAVLSARERAGRNLFATIPIVLAGSMAVGLGLTGPIEPVVPKRAEKPKSTPVELAKTLRTAFASATAKASPAPVATSTITPVVAQVAAAPTTYTVVAGDTVSGIAGRYGLATASVLALNGLGWKSVIFPGQVLKLTNSGAVPVAATPAVSTTVTRYTIRSGDTMGSIAARFGVSTQTLLSANGLGWSSIIYPGQSVAIPSTGTTQAPVTASPAVSVAPIASAPAAPTTGSYVIKSGDTVSSIASRFGVTTQALLSANGLSLSSVIYSGHSLVIPGAAASTGTSGIVLASSTTSTLTPEMTANARTIISVGRSLGVPDYGIVIAIATSLQESGLRNLPYGDLDSLGLFQQRPSAGWGTPSQLLDPSYATRLFFGGPSNPNKGNTKGLLDISGWQSMTVTQAAQAVQHSAYPNAYAKWEATARLALSNLG
jgi:LysM repeat protein